MHKEVSMTIRVEPDLRASFAEAAGLEQRPVAQVLRDLMRDYVAQMQARKAAPPISEQERRRREDAVRYAQASVGLEGFVLSDAYTKEAERFIRGEITLREFGGKVRELA
ncbi:MAG: antitoxin VbhA family protein [Pseudomonadales bacterium]|jgi:hypothetical protein|nr:antitoxin VbhA family protein [Pseudomonadales bacterium]